MLIHCSLLPKFAVRESYNPHICQNDGIARTFTHTKIFIFTVYIFSQVQSHLIFMLDSCKYVINVEMQLGRIFITAQYFIYCIRLNTSLSNRANSNFYVWKTFLDTHAEGEHQLCSIRQVVQSGAKRKSKRKNNTRGTPFVLVT